MHDKLLKDFHMGKKKVSGSKANGGSTSKDDESFVSPIVKVVKRSVLRVFELRGRP